MKFFTIISIPLFILCMMNVAKAQGENGIKTIVIENNFIKYEIDESGKNFCFVDKRNGINYLNSDSVSYCAYIERGGQRYRVSKVIMKPGKILELQFQEGHTKVDIEINSFPGYIVFQIIRVHGDADAINFIHVPLSLKGAVDEPFGACALALNDFTHVRQLPALQTDIWASCYKKFGQVGAKIALVGVPVKKMLAEIREIMEKRADIPISHAGGAWAMQNPDAYSSYIMNFGGLTKQTVDSWIKMCHDLGFNQIDNHGGGFFNFGELKIDSLRFPNGWKDFRDINRKLKAAGISSILHTYAYFIDKNSKYVRPQVSPDLGYFNSFTLSRDISPQDTVITVNESTEDISTIVGFFVRNSVSLRLGDELIEFTGVTRTAPFQFTGCKRASHGTRASAHRAGEKAYHLKEVYGRFTADPNSKLFKEMAKRTAEIANEAEFSGIYLDAVDGGDVLGGPENFWYYPSRFVFEIVRHLKRPVGMEMASMTHFWWHYRSRWQAWDIPQRGFKRFIDLHLAAVKSPNLFLSSQIKSNDFEHGVWAGDSSLINRYADMENGSLMLPLSLGWWSNVIGVPPQTETTFTDDIEYLGGKLLGNNASTAMLGGFDPGTRQKIPLFGRLDSILRQYEVLRKAHYFNDSIMAILRQPGKEFQLFKQDDGRWNFRPTLYSEHKISGEGSSEWEVFNPFEGQPIQIRLEALKSVSSYNDTSGQVISNFGFKEYVLQNRISGMSGTIKPSSEALFWKEGTGHLTAANMGKKARNASWINIEYSYDPPLNIEDKQGLGVWVKGDGKGELLNFRLESPKYISHGARGDHFIKIDFEGWKYFELVELESSDFSNYFWPVSDLHIYDSYRHNISFKTINKFQVWLNNLPYGDTVNCWISPVKALPLINKTIKNPVIRINGKEIRFPVVMESGTYLEMNINGYGVLYNNNGTILQQFQLHDIPSMHRGINDLQFSSEGPGNINTRMKITLRTQGKPIINY